MVEMALVMPILLFLALGIVDFGRAINYWNDVNQIAADGARFAAVNKNPGTTTPPPVTRLPRSGSALRPRRASSRTAPSPAADPAELPVTPIEHRRVLAVGHLASSRSASSPAEPGQPLTGDSRSGTRSRSVVETTYNLIPFLGAARRSSARSQIKRQRRDAARAELHDGTTGCTAHERDCSDTCAGAPATSGARALIFVASASRCSSCSASS